MTRPRIPIKCGKILHDTSADRIQVQISHKLQQVRVLLDKDGLVAVLADVASALVPTVESYGIASEESAHGGGENGAVGDVGPAGWGANEQVDMVGEECPGEDVQTCLLNDDGKAVQERPAILVVTKEGAALQSTHHEMVDGVRSFESRASRHDVYLEAGQEGCQRKVK
jgi:hypothetical protein